MFHADDTIAAIASSAGGGLRGIVRLSGPRVIQCLTACFTPQHGIDLDQIDAATCLAGQLKPTSLACDLPCELYLWPTHRSYTRQPSAEIHTIGSPPLLDSVIGTLCVSGARLAQPGEFTMRAFLAGRLDLTQAEAVLGVIDAAGEHELNTALSQLAGGLANPLNELRDQLLNLLAQLEAGLDFVEEDIEFIPSAELELQLGQAIDIVTGIFDQMRNRLVGLPQRRVVLTGWPNVGKSSLLNALAGERVAIVSDESGTTLDYLSGVVDLSGLLVTLIDTAGVEEQHQHDSLQSQAQLHASEQSGQAHLRLLCLDSTRPLNPWERKQLGRRDEWTVTVLTKCEQPWSTNYEGPAVKTSASTGAGLSSLRNQIRERLVRAASDDAAILGATGARCGESLRMAVECLQRARQANVDELGDELVASEVRVALNELGHIVGAVYTDEILDHIFSRFCIGK